MKILLTFFVLFFSSALVSEEIYIDCTCLNFKIELSAGSNKFRDLSCGKGATMNDS